jgi:hypothetical protein
MYKSVQVTTQWESGIDAGDTRSSPLSYSYCWTVGSCNSYFKSHKYTSFVKVKHKVI